MIKRTNRITTVSISEKTYTGCDVHPAMRRESKIIIHDGWEWYLGRLKDEKQLEDFLKFFEIELSSIHDEVYHATTGKIIFYNLTKNLNSTCDGGFYSIEHLTELSNGQQLKQFKGLSNGSIVDCYAGIGEDVIDIYRPNPNYKDVYKRMEFQDELQYRRNNWYI